MKTAKLSLAILFTVASLAGCAGTEQYEISGEVRSASASGPIVLELFEIDGEEQESLKRVTLDAPGAFKETVEATAEAKLLVRAVADADGNGACTEGEPWAEKEVTPKEDGTVEPIILDLLATACPK